jgi:hypothetical protein
MSLSEMHYNVSNFTSPKLLPYLIQNFSCVFFFNVVSLCEVFVTKLFKNCPRLHVVYYLPILVSVWHPNNKNKQRSEVRVENVFWNVTQCSVVEIYIRCKKHGTSIFRVDSIPVGVLHKQRSFCNMNFFIFVLVLVQCYQLLALIFCFPFAVNHWFLKCESYWNVMKGLCVLWSSPTLKGIGLVWCRNGVNNKKFVPVAGALKYAFKTYWPLEAWI